jgi:hypothetical protein
LAQPRVSVLYHRRTRHPPPPPLHPPALAILGATPPKRGRKTPPDPNIHHTPFRRSVRALAARIRRQSCTRPAPPNLGRKDLRVLELWLRGVWWCDLVSTIQPQMVHPVQGTTLPVGERGASSSNMQRQTSRAANQDATAAGKSPTRTRALLLMATAVGAAGQGNHPPHTSSRPNEPGAKLSDTALSRCSATAPA